MRPRLARRHTGVSARLDAVDLGIAPGADLIPDDTAVEYAEDGDENGGGCGACANAIIPDPSIEYCRMSPFGF